MLTQEILSLKGHLPFSQPWAFQILIYLHPRTVHVQGCGTTHHAPPVDTPAEPSYPAFKTPITKGTSTFLLFPAMALFPVVVFLAAVLLPSLPAEKKDPSFSSLITSQTQIQREIVNKHNELRKSVSPPASNMLKMEWSTEVTANAQKWANKCTLLHSNAEDRKTSTKCGENLYMSSDPITWSNAIQNWYDESHNFVYGVGPKTSNAVVGHYTQVVWYSSYRVGCGVAYCPNQDNLKYYYVCQYCPAGNNISKKNTPYQQGTPCASCPGHCDNGLCTNSCEYEDLLTNCSSLKKTAGCDNELLKEKCKATCQCENKIY